MTRRAYTARSRRSCCGCGCTLPLLLLVLLAGGFALFLYWPSRTYISGATPIPQDLQRDALHLRCHYLPVNVEEVTAVPFRQISHRETGDLWFVLDLDGNYTWFQPDVLLQETVTIVSSNPDLALGTPVDPALMVALFQAIPISRLFVLLPYLPTMQACDPATLSLIRESYATGAAFLTWSDRFPQNQSPAPTSQAIPAAKVTLPATPEPAPTIPAEPTARLPEAGLANVNANIRAGPGTEYMIAGSAPQGTRLTITGRNEDGTWLQLASGNWIYAPLVDPAQLQIMDSPTPAQPAPAVALPEVETLPTPVATVAPDVAALYARALFQINEARSQQGLSPVVLGFNAAAQTHAGELHAAQYLSHWDRQGLTPYMRYTWAGGQGYSAENVAFIGRLTDQQCVPHNTDDWLDQLFAGLMASPGHRDNILNPHHTSVHLGIVHACHLMVMVQLFAGDYVEFVSAPQITNGVLTLQGHTLHGTTLHDSLFLYWDPLPYPLPREQLMLAACYSSAGTPVAIILAPLANSNAYYVTDQTHIERERCPTPYDVGTIPDVPASQPELQALFQRIKAQPLIQESFVVPHHIADILDTSPSTFHIQADIGQLLARQGPGIYSIVLYGYRGHETDESILLSTYALWIQ